MGLTLGGHPDDKCGWAVVSGAEIKLDFLSPGSRIAGYFNYGVGASAFGGGSNLTSPGFYGSGNEIAFGAVTDAVYANNTGLELTTSWTAGGGFEYFWTRNFWSTIYGNYTQVSYSTGLVNTNQLCTGPFNGSLSCDPGFKCWTVGTHHDWFPLPGLRFAVDVLYTAVESEMSGQTVTLGTKVGARPSGTYTVKDLGITSVVFRAQRSWGAD